MSESGRNASATLSPSGVRSLAAATERYRGRQIVVVGMERSGVAAARLLARCGASVRVTELRCSESLERVAHALQRQEIAVELGRHSVAWLDGCELVVTSPGVPPSAAPLVWAEAEGIPVISEIELAWQACPAPVVAVTGTNGKTTVTMLIGRMVQASGRQAIICGNIGNPFSGEVDRLAPDGIAVVEISSFQLERTTSFAPRVAVLLNLAQDHLDRYASLEAYYAAKRRLFVHQGASDIAVLNSDDPAVAALAGSVPSAVRWFGSRGLTDSTLPPEALANPNFHAAAVAATAIGVSRETIAETLRTFQGVEHRCEVVATIGGIKFINDSKATNVDSVLWALRLMAQPVVLIAGGRDKGSDYRPLRGPVADRVRHVVLIGEAAPLIRRALEGVVSISDASDLREAVQRAAGIATVGMTVLLSPACASFDMFRNYEHRGQEFKRLVQELAVVETGSSPAS